MYADSEMFVPGSENFAWCDEYVVSLAVLSETGLRTGNLVMPAISASWPEIM